MLGESCSLLLLLLLLLLSVDFRMCSSIDSVWRFVTCVICVPSYATTRMHTQEHRLTIRRLVIERVLYSEIDAFDEVKEKTADLEVQ